MARRSEGWTLHRDPRTHIWTVRFRVAGQRCHRSTRTRDRAEAQRRAPAIVEEVNRGPARTTSDELSGLETLTLCSRWLAQMEVEKRPATVATWTLYTKAHFVDHFANAAELTSERCLAAYVAQRLRKATGTTVAKECSALQSLLRWAARPEVGLIEQAPKVPRPRRGSGTSKLPKIRVDLTETQVEAILAALPETVRAKDRGDPPRPCRAFFRLLWETGLRRGTLYRLEAPGDYHRGRETLRIRGEADKAGFGRELPLSDAARDALDAVVPERGLLFEQTDFRTRLGRAAKLAGVPPALAKHVSHHDFRHARTTALLDEGGSLTGVAYLLGHKQVTTTNRYAHAGEKAAREVLSGHQSGHRAERVVAKLRRGNAKALEIPGLSGMGHGGLEPPANGLRGERSSEKLRDFQRVAGSGRDTKGHRETHSGHGVPIAEFARRFAEAIEGGDPFALSRALDLGGQLADWIAAAADAGRAVEERGR